MTMIVTLEQAKAHLRVSHDSDDEDITLKIHAASGAIISYLKSAADVFLDTTGEVLGMSDSPPVSSAPYVVQQATLLLVGDFFKDREPSTEEVALTQFGHGYGYLPRAVVALLYPLRDPALS